MTTEEVSRLLPFVFQQALGSRSEDGPATPLDVIVELMVNLLNPIERSLETVDQAINPRLCSRHMVPFLARWQGLGGLQESGVGRAVTAGPGRFPLELGRLRELVARAPELARNRGTRKGILMFLETATGVQGFQIEENRNSLGEACEFHVHVTAPTVALASDPLVLRIIELAKPAHVTSEISSAPEPESPAKTVARKEQPTD